MRKLVASAFASFAILMLPATSSLADITDAANNSAVEMTKVWKVDFRGRPPFKRELVEIPVADVAALEIENKIVETEVSWQVDYSGRPPFKRRLLEIPVIDAASLEIEAEDQSRIKRRPLGSFKRHR